MVVRRASPLHAARAGRGDVRRSARMRGAGVREPDRRRRRAAAVRRPPGDRAALRGRDDTYPHADAPALRDVSQSPVWVTAQALTGLARRPFPIR
jgi:hypothetical protein